MKYIKIPVFCNNCGKSLFVEFSGLIGRNWRVCSMDCHHEMEIKYACSIVGQEFDPSMVKKNETK